MKIKIGSYWENGVTPSGDPEDQIQLPGAVETPCRAGHDLNYAQQLAAIEKALSRLDHGTYGFCADCGDEISVRRLMKNPLTSTCDDCQT